MAQIAFKKIIEKLKKEKILTKDEFAEIKKIASKKLKSVEEILIEQKPEIDKHIGKIRAKSFNLPFIKLSEQRIPDSVLLIVPFPVASNQKIITFGKEKKILKIATCNPQNLEILNFLEKKTRLEVEVYYTTAREIRKTLNLYTKDIHKKFDRLLKNVLDDPNKIESLEDATKILDTILTFGQQNNASDIHLEPHTNYFLIRYRIDGILHDIVKLPKEVQDLLTTRIKVLSGLRTDEHRAAQDGRFKFATEDEEITLRVSIIPIYYGEKVVLRILSSKPQHLDLKTLGYSDNDFEIVQKNILKTHGMILVTGTTGSGKTTTLYATLQMMNSREVNIATIEDPIEYHLEGINQIQVNNKTNLNFAMGLRAILRQDPDIIMVGEIRDEETASIAINSALTGHQVLATLHTNNASSSLPRLLEMGIESFLVASTINLVIAQRLVRRICENCKETYPLKDVEINEIQKIIPPHVKAKDILHKLKKQTYLTKARGCDECSFTGFKGRVCICELLELNEEIRNLTLQNASPKTIEKAALESGMNTMLLDGLNKVLDGLTTLEEVLRVMRE